MNTLSENKNMHFWRKINDIYIFSHNTTRKPFQEEVHQKAWRFSNNNGFFLYWAAYCSNHSSSSCWVWGNHLPIILCYRSKLKKNLNKFYINNTWPFLGRCHMPGWITVGRNEKAARVLTNTCSCIPASTSLWLDHCQTNDLEGKQNHGLQSQLMLKDDAQINSYSVFLNISL